MFVVQPRRVENSRGSIGRPADRTWRVCALINSGLSEAGSFLNDPGSRVCPSVAGQAVRGETLLQTVLDCLDDAKAEDTTLIDLHGKTSIADAMIISTGRSNVHVNAIADRVAQALKQDGQTLRIEGLAAGDWVLIDAGDLIIHIFRPDVRTFYNLEKMWGADRPVTG